MSKKRDKDGLAKCVECGDKITHGDTTYCGWCGEPLCPSCIQTIPFGGTEVCVSCLEGWKDDEYSCNPEKGEPKWTR